MSSTPPPPASTPAGWYPDSTDPSLQRYWNGTGWTEHTAPASVATPPSATPATTGLGRTAKGWIIGGSVVAGLLLIGGVSNALNGSRDDRQPVANGEESSIEEPTPSATPTPSQTPTEEPVEQAPAAAAVDPAAFRTEAQSHLADITKDLDDMVVTLQEQGFWRLLSNPLEIAFNLGQLEALEVPTSVEGEWTASLGTLDANLTAMTDVVATEDPVAIQAQIDAMRATVTTLNEIAGRAQ